jgi:hypothetical protein
MTGTNCDLFTHNQSRSYLNHLVHIWMKTCPTVVTVTHFIFCDEWEHTDGRLFQVLGSGLSTTILGHVS